LSKILVIGGGFAGLAAVERFSWGRHHHEVVLIDVRNSSHFLPLLPDIVGKPIIPHTLAYSLKNAAQRWKFRFVQAVVQSVDLSSKSVITDKGKEFFDALLIASGSETDFRNRESLRGKSFSLDCIDDAVRIRDSVVSNDHAHYVVCGGGYTGVEIASNLQHLIRRKKLDQKVSLIGRGKILCPSLPGKHGLYLANELRRSGVEVCLSTTVVDKKGDQVDLSDGSNIRNAKLVWTAGVCTAPYVQNLPFPKNRQGRLEVDPFLAVGSYWSSPVDTQTQPERQHPTKPFVESEECIFAAGDAAGFPNNGGLLRMGIQFSLTQGWHAAGNILRRLDGTALVPYRPFDPGWVVPLANHRGCGTIFGVTTFGRLPVFLHYFMSVVRSIGFDNRLKLISHLL